VTNRYSYYHRLSIGIKIENFNNLEWISNIRLSGRPISAVLEFLSTCMADFVIYLMVILLCRRSVESDSSDEDNDDTTPKTSRIQKAKATKGSTLPLPAAPPRVLLPYAISASSRRPLSSSHSALPATDQSMTSSSPVLLQEPAMAPSAINLYPPAADESISMPSSRPVPVSAVVTSPTLPTIPAYGSPAQHSFSREPPVRANNGTNITSQFCYILNIVYF